MKANMGGADRGIRLILVAIYILLVLIGILNPANTLGLVLGIIAIIFSLTSAMNFCPAYGIVGLSTCKR